VSDIESSHLRALVGIGLAAMAAVAVVGGGTWVVAVVGVAMVGAAVVATRMAAAVRREDLAAVASADPSSSHAAGSVAAAVGERLARERVAAAHLTDGLGRVVEEAGFGVLVLERDGRVVAGIGQVAAVVGTGADRRVKAAAVLALVGAALDGGGTVEETLVMGARSRSYRWVVVPLDDLTVGAVLSDVTELERIQAMRRSFVTDASHELKTPIATIQATAEALQLALGRDEERARHFAGRLEEQADRLGRIVRDLLDLSRLETDAIEPVSFDLGAVVGIEVEGVRSTAEAAGVRLSSEVAPVGIEGDPADIALAIRNVLTNAIAYTPAGGRVSLWAGEREGRAVVEVADTGIGIPAADQERIFNRFYRVDGARTRETGGTGLGLAIVRHVLDQHGGTVSVRSVLGQGSTFTLDLGDVVPFTAG